MTSRKEKEQRDKIVGKIIDAFFDSRISISQKLHLDMVEWLLDEKDAGLKEKHMKRKFDEIMESDDDAPEEPPLKRVAGMCIS